MELNSLSAQANSSAETSLILAELQNGNVALAWTLTLLAGVSTVIGALFVSFATPERRKYVAFLEAFTAGVMIQGSLSGLNAEAKTLASASVSHTAAFWTVLVCFFAGAG
eukprot:scaffold102864_cov40-Prasinocladus_malaysianus.AAC.1